MFELRFYLLLYMLEMYSLSSTEFIIYIMLSVLHALKRMTTVEKYQHLPQERQWHQPSVSYIKAGNHFRGNL